MENSNTFYDRLLRDQFNEEEQLDIISKDPCFIMHMHDASIKVQEKAIGKDPNVIRHIRDQSKRIQWLAIEQGCLLKYIKEPDINMMCEAIIKNPINIMYVNYECLICGEYFLNLAIESGAESILEKSLETNNCEQSKAALEAVKERRYKNFLKNKKKMIENTKILFFLIFLKLTYEKCNGISIDRYPRVDIWFWISRRQYL